MVHISFQGMYSNNCSSVFLADFCSDFIFIYILTLDNTYLSEIVFLESTPSILINLCVFLALI